MRKVNSVANAFTARAKTGSGKTAAYVLPILQSILKRRATAKSTPSTSAIILVPTKELASQVTKSISTLAAYCSKDIRTVNLTPQISEPAQRALLATSPDIVISTPSRISQHLNSSTLVATDLAHLVIDEADLVLSYGYEEDFQNIVALLPKGVQTFLASATLSTEVDTLKGLFCRDPVVLDLQQEEKETAVNNVSQYVVKCGEDEKFVLLYALFKLKLVKGKAIVFVGDVDRCYRVKLFLEQFGIKSCVLNSELPVNCRIHVVEEFNKNIYDILIASDENEVLNAREGKTRKSKKAKKEEKDMKNVEEEKGEDDDDQEATTLEATEPEVTSDKEVDSDNEAASSAPPKQKKQKKSKYSKSNSNEFSISRGIDFHHVTLVLNFDLPLTPSSYTHRIGRTARGSTSTGLALSFAIPTPLYHKHRHLTHPSTEHDPIVLNAIERSQAKRGAEIKPYNFDMAKLEGFKYRVNSGLKAITPGAVREARIRELRSEMLRSERLKRHLEENPEDREFLRHDAELRPAKVRPEMRHVPEYLMPSGKNADGESNGGLGRDGKGGFVGFVKQGGENRIRAARARNKMRGGKSGAKRGEGYAKGRKADPLRTFKGKK